MSKHWKVVVRRVVEFVCASGNVADDCADHGSLLFRSSKTHNYEKFPVIVFLVDGITLIRSAELFTEIS